jgi:hypothetical protein
MLVLPFHLLHSTQAFVIILLLSSLSVLRYTSAGILHFNIESEEVAALVLIKQLSPSGIE